MKQAQDKIRHLTILFASGIFFLEYVIPANFFMASLLRRKHFIVQLLIVLRHPAQYVLFIHRLFIPDVS